MKLWRQMIVFALSLSIATTLNPFPPAMACGPFTIDPIFVFRESPDLPFDDFTKGRIGIVRPGFGRKTLVIAYRYLNGGSFNEDEQQSLVTALRGKAPEESGANALKAWVAARKELLKENETLPEIYTERKRESYEFFPNCAKNAFEVATATLKDRIASYGAEDTGVRDWIAAQDIVFQTCSGGTNIPNPLGAESPQWLRKDREYQIAAAFFYSLNFEEAQRRFGRIADDSASPWGETSRYLVARTLVRQASLAKDEAAKHELYVNAEVELQSLLAQSPSFQNSAQKLLNLVKYRLHPSERIQELARTLAGQSGNDNLRQDLIDYVWLLDGIEARILEAEKKRKEALKPPEQREQTGRSFPSDEARERYEAIQRGELINLSFAPKTADGKEDYRNYIVLDFKYDATESEILQAMELKINRRFTDEETKELHERWQGALKYREWLISPNRKLGNGGLSPYEGCYYDCERLTFDLMPEFLRHDDLTDWILTLQTEDAGAYAHALSRWRDTDSRAWLAIALIKADKSSPHINDLMRDAEAVGRDAPEFPTVAHELVRLKVAFGKKEAARNLVNEVISHSSELLPRSALNQFLEQRGQLAENLTDFLKYAQRKPAAFSDYGRYGSLNDLLKIGKASWDSEFSDQTKEEYEQETEDKYKDLLAWDERFILDDETVDILNWHFPLETLVVAARDQALPSYLQRQLVLVGWTRAILLQRDELALRIAPEVIRLAPEISSVFGSYLEARTPSERNHAALFVLLKFPSLSPFVAGGLPSFETSEQIDYYFESSWWCALPTTEYRDSHEVPKVVRKPEFLTAKQLEAAVTERNRLSDIGDGKPYLGKLVLQWARTSPADPRIPEALFIAFNANGTYKYGCGSWEHDEHIQQETETILRKRYPMSSWTASLPKPEDQ